QGQRDVGFQEGREQDALVQRLEDFHDGQEHGALNQRQQTQHPNLREDVGYNAQIDGAFAPVNGRLLDDLTSAIDTTKEHGDEGDDEQSVQRVDALADGNEVLQGRVH